METNATPVLPRIVPVCMIRTRFLGPTNFRGARIVASMLADRETRATVSYPYERSGSDAHVPAVLALIDKANAERDAMGWPRIVVGSLLSCGEDGGGYVWAVQESQEVRS